MKIREQAKAYLEMKGELTSGLNLINCTNLEYFASKHQAEIFRLKGDFFLKLNDCENANVVYSNAISVYKHLPKGWISWGNYCDMVCLFLSCFFMGKVSSIIVVNYLVLFIYRFIEKPMMKCGWNMPSVVSFKASNMVFLILGVI